MENSFRLMLILTISFIFKADHEVISRLLHVHVPDLIVRPRRHYPVGRVAGRPPAFQSPRWTEVVRETVVHFVNAIIINLSFKLMA